MKTLARKKGAKDREAKYQGTCQLSGCGKAFRSHRPWSKFCCAEHRDTFNNERIARARKLLNETEKQNPPPPLS
jgi:hypothetical protein